MLPFPHVQPPPHEPGQALREELMAEVRRMIRSGLSKWEQDEAEDAQDVDQVYLPSSDSPDSVR